MPKVTIVFDPRSRLYLVEEYARCGKDNDEYEAVMDMKASHFRNMKRNEDKFYTDQNTLRKFFIEAQMRGREFREQ